MKTRYVFFLAVQFINFYVSLDQKAIFQQSSMLRIVACFNIKKVGAQIFLRS